MRRDPSADQPLRLCGLLALIAGALVVITMQRDLPDTSLNAIIDGVRFVLAVGVAIGGVIVLIERRIEAREALEARGAHDDVVIDLRGTATSEHNAASVPR